jgi:hypothetical protein
MMREPGDVMRADRVLRRATPWTANCDIEGRSRLAGSALGIFGHALKDREQRARQRDAIGWGMSRSLLILVERRLPEKASYATRFSRSSVLAAA